MSRTGFSRFPMLDDEGMLSGYLHIKDVLSIPEAGYQHPIAESRIRSLANLAMDDEIEKAMSVMQRTGSHLARVIGRTGTPRACCSSRTSSSCWWGRSGTPRRPPVTAGSDRSSGACLTLNRNDSYLGLDSVVLLTLLNNRTEVLSVRRSAAALLLAALSSLLLTCLRSDVWR